MTTTTEQPYAYPVAGEVIDGKYRIDGYLGEGGMGAVARAWHTLRQAPVALKFMAPHLASEPSAVERFMNEAVAASQLKSEHIVQVFDVGKLPGGSPYLVLEYLEGHDAAQLLEEETKEGTTGLDVPRAAHIVFQVLRGLDVAHAAGIIHRDLKPSNCFLVRHESDPEFVKILDFGISKIQREGQASITQTNVALGTPLYMSPEQARSSRDVDLRSDLYSTGVILYELLCGTAPHMVDDGAFTAVLFRLFTTDAPPIGEKRAGLPDELVKVVHKALEREPGKRYQTAREFADALAPFCDGRSAIEVARFRAALTRVETLEQGRVRVHSTHDVGTHDATQMGSSPAPSMALEKPEASVARTDLSAATDTSRPETGESASASRFRVPIVAGAVAAVALLAVSAVVISGRSSAPTTAHDPVVPSTTSAPPVVASTAVPSAVPTAPVVVSAAPSASVAPSATATAVGTQHVHLNRVTVIQ